MLLDLLVFFAMFLQDSAASAKIRFLEHGRPWLAGFCELVNDWGAVISIGVSGAVAIKFGFCVQTVGVFIALGCASVFGTVFGNKIEEWFARRRS